LDLKQEVSDLQGALEELNWKTQTEAKESMTEYDPADNARDEQILALKHELASLGRTLDIINSKKPSEAKESMTESDPADSGKDE
jgi:hypothetical protein